MRESRVKKLWAGGKSVLNGWCAIPSSFSAEAMAGLGWDAVTIDMQHGVIDYQVAVTMFQAISITSATPMARVPWNDPSAVMKALDAGAYGLICPLINDRAEAEAFARACRYPPRGYRSSGPIRASLYGGPDYMAKADDVIVTLAMIETAEGLANLDDILSVKELDGVYVGPSDLSLSLGGTPGLDQTEPKVFGAIEKIVKSAKKHGKRAGIQTGNVAYAKRMLDLGFDLVTVCSDFRLMIAAGTQVVAEMRGAGGSKAGGSVY
jgi:4-hydroxy-2-oxoheptanedioate aldolase